MKGNLEASPRRISGVLQNSLRIRRLQKNEYEKHKANLLSFLQMEDLTLLFPCSLRQTAVILNLAAEHSEEVVPRAIGAMRVRTVLPEIPEEARIVVPRVAQAAAAEVVIKQV